MMMHDGRSPTDRPGLRRLLPIAGGGVAVAAVLAHFAGGGLLMHVGVPALLAYLGFGAASTNLGGALVLGIVAVVAIKLLMVLGVFGGAFGARQWWQHRRSHEADQFKSLKEDAMWVRTVTVETQPGQVDEFVRRWQAQVAPHIPEVPELHRVFVCGNRDANTVMAVQFWDNPPDQASHEIHDRL